MVAATFVSNTQYYSYPIELWKQGLKGFETKVFECRKVFKPEDIAIIQNECLTELFKTHDRVYWLQADLIFDSEQTEKLLNLIDDSEANSGFGIQKVKLYYDQGISCHGSVVMKRELFHEKDSRFWEDGAQPERMYQHTDVYGIDVGYLGYKNFIEHTRQQTRIRSNIEMEPPRGGNIIKTHSVFDYFDLNNEYINFKKRFKK